MPPSLLFWREGWRKGKGHCPQQPFRKGARSPSLRFLGLEPQEALPSLTLLLPAGQGPSRQEWSLCRETDQPPDLSPLGREFGAWPLSTSPGSSVKQVLLHSTELTHNRKFPCTCTRAYFSLILDFCFCSHSRQGVGGGWSPSFPLQECYACASLNHVANLPVP